MKRKILYLVAEDSYFCSHRLGLAKATLDSGFHVMVASRCKDHVSDIEKAGIQSISLKYFTRSGLNPIRQLLSLLELWKIYRRYRPDIVHHVAMKPVILGTMVARLTRVPRIINALGGLGFLFTELRRPDWKMKFKQYFLRRLTCLLLGWLNNQCNIVLILQNQDDVNTLITTAKIKPKHIVLIRGSGVNIESFPFVPLPTTSPTIIACVSRMLWDKGIGELVAAARILKEKKIPANIFLYGAPDPENPSSISESQLNAWQNEGLITWQGHSNNVQIAYSHCHIAVLPSYREGLPRSLLEAASTGRPIVTTDTPGCREVVENGENGILVPVKNSEKLAETLIHLIQNPQLLNTMGIKSRMRIETYFEENIILKQTLALY